MAIRWVLTTISIFIMAYIISAIVKRYHPDGRCGQYRRRDHKQGDTLNIKEQCCIGCGICTKLSPDNFELVNGKARVTQKQIKGDIKDNIRMQ